MKVKIFYHGSDMDGYASGYIAKKYMLKYHPEAEITMIPLIYNERILKISDFTDMRSDDIIIVADWSLTENDFDTINYIINNNLHLIWCDHHETSIRFENEFLNTNNLKVEGIRSIENSGAYLLYQYLSNKYDKEILTVPEWLEYVSDYDTFHLKYQVSKAFNYGIINSGKHDPRYNTSIWNFLDSENKIKSQNSLSRVIHHGKQILKFLFNDNKKYVQSNGFECTLDGIKCLACNKISNSLLFESITETYPLLCAFVFDGEKYRYSIYSKGDVDCSEIAGKYGGGGHKGAAGFTSKELIFKDMKKLKNK